MYVYVYIYIGWSMVTDYHKSLCDHRKALSKIYHDLHYLDIKKTFINFNSFANSSKAVFAIILIAEICNLKITVLKL